MKIYQVTYTIRGIYADDETHAIEQADEMILDGQADIDIKQVSEELAL